ncbi:glycosyltransferase family 2 protein [Tropicimonas sp. IMCC6043]|uniref:glycosyltransferase family 2 protein n=1 Tax=Tropicimonas sp. IMCC6043 TaxID=2510645 RepID=UPI00101CC1FB|nr:glycosyltransferase [Tropicimonas sp. IMCC6043]RYH08772.1 glycosyltransferase [Tropicimonas sp. IMCC6043]
MTAPTHRSLLDNPVPLKRRPRIRTVRTDTRVIEGGGSSKNLLGQRLVNRGALAPGDLVKALAMQARQDARLGDILLANSMVSESTLLDVLSEQWQTDVVDLEVEPPDARLIDEWSATRCLGDGLVPWRRTGASTIVATARPERFAAHRDALEARFGKVHMALTTEPALHRAITALRNPVLSDRAEQRVRLDMSCRGWDGRRAARIVTVGLLAFLTAALLWPVATFSLLTLWAIATLVATLGLKAAALFFAARTHHAQHGELFHTIRRTGPVIARLPTVSVMVPLFREAEIAGRLIRRLERLAYPKELMDILLVAEETDTLTRAALARTALPRWMRVIVVPAGGVQTKPRALNYALDFCKGQIVGVWDAEDAPDADQLHKVVRRFHERGPEVACLQGKLDYYNARANWLSRCFTIEYASWFGVVLPGLQRMRLALPLGGTTLYFRRAALEALGGWDAHNVTEDADLGMRLVRMGYRTEMVDTTTKEEANCRVLPWIRQRSRWLKGYAMTWAVHMRAPRQLWRDLGPRQFAGFQVLFLGTLSQFLLAPVLWSFWLLAFGLPHPLSGLVPAALYWPLMGLFVSSEIVGVTLGLFATRGRGHRFLMPWVPTLHLYFPLAAIASYKALFELLMRPFYWDKTRHGLYDETQEPEPVTLEAMS